MSILATAFVGIVALLHGWFLVLEMFLWATPFGVKTFGRTREQQLESKVLAANQGLYNGFLAAGLAWSLVAPADYALALKTFFLGCVIIAGAYGGVTVGRRILIVQALPAVVALAAVWTTRG